MKMIFSIAFIFMIVPRLSVAQDQCSNTLLKAFEVCEEIHISQRLSRVEDASHILENKALDLDGPKIGACLIARQTFNIKSKAADNSLHQSLLMPNNLHKEAQACINALRDCRRDCPEDASADTRSNNCRILFLRASRYQVYFSAPQTAAQAYNNGDRGFDEINKCNDYCRELFNSTCRLFGAKNYSCTKQFNELAQSDSFNCNMDFTSNPIERGSSASPKATK